MPSTTPERLPHGPAYVRLPLPPRAVAEVKWWRHLARELVGVVRRRRAADVRSALAGARAGFYPSTRALYPLEGPERRLYISDRWRELSWAIDWPAAGFLDDKLAFFVLMRHFGVPTPEVVGVVIRGRVHRFGDPAQPPLRAWLPAWLAERGPLVVRPNRGTGGQGVLVLEASDAGACVVNGERTTWAALEERFAASVDHVITEFVEQAGYARGVFPPATNTIRILTMQDEAGQPFVGAAVHRFGTPSSAPADNFMKGGLSVPIDPDTGVMGTGVQRFGLQRHVVHPQTGVQLDGMPVPAWDRMRDGVLAAAGQAAFLPFIGWDVIPTEDGYSVIEGNKNSDMQVYQVHRPLLPVERIRAFYAQHGLILPRTRRGRA